MNETPGAEPPMPNARIATSLDDRKAAIKAFTKRHMIKNGLLVGMQSPADVFGLPAKVVFRDSSVGAAFGQVAGRINRAMKKDRGDPAGSKE